MRLKHFLSVFLTLLTLSVGQMWGETATFSPSDFSGQGTSGSGSAISATKNTVTFACNKGYGTTQFRCYSGSKITISSSNTITAISFTTTSGYGGGLSNQSNLETNEWTFTTTSQARITQCVVTFSSGCTGTKLGTPVVTAEASSGQIKLTWPAVSNASGYQLKWNGGDWAAATSPVTKTGLTNGTAYTYQVKAIGNGSTYCDGDASAAASATPNVYYTVTWNNNGAEYTTTQVVSGQRPTFPEAPNSCDDGEGASTTFYGWATSTWSGKAATLEDSKLSGITIYTQASDMPTVTGNGVVYNAVFCKGGGGSVTLTGSDFHDQLGQSYSDYTITKTIGETNYTFTLNACEPNNTGNKCQMRDNSTISYIQIPSLPAVITRITATSISNSSDAAYTGTLHFKSAKSRGNANTNDIARVTYDSGITSLDWDLSSDNTTYTSGYFLTSAGLRMTDFTVYYGGDGEDYITTCCSSLGSINGSFFWTTHFCPAWPAKHRS